MIRRLESGREVAATSASAVVFASVNAGSLQKNTFVSSESRFENFNYDERLGLRLLGRGLASGGRSSSGRHRIPKAWSRELSAQPARSLLVSPMNSAQYSWEPERMSLQQIGLVQQVKVRGLEFGTQLGSRDLWSRERDTI